MSCKWLKGYREKDDQNTRDEANETPSIVFSSHYRKPCRALANYDRFSSLEPIQKSNFISLVKEHVF